MSVETDPALYRSDFERREGDRYFTEPWVTRALLRAYPEIRRCVGVWEPAAGRGDMVQVLRDFAYDVVASDLDLSEYNDELAPAFEYDFLTDAPWSIDPRETYGEDFEIDAIVTNPPYADGMTDWFVDRGLRHLQEGSPSILALLLRTEFASGGRRVTRGAFDAPFACEIRLTSRPRWDWWYEPAPGERRTGPRHNFSWYVWDTQWRRDPIIRWAGRD